MTFNLTYDSSISQYLVFISEPSDVTSYNLTISKIGEGEVTPYEGTQSQKPGSTVAINAIADTLNDYRFKDWNINGIENLDSLTYVEINKAVEAIATFIKQYQVTITPGLGGSVSPQGSAYYDVNDTISITATVDDPSTSLDYWTVNTINVGDDNPLQYTVTETADIIAFFKGVINYIQDVFGTTPNGQVFEDQSLNGNDVTYKNVQVGTFGGTVRLSPQLPLISTGDVVIKIRFSTTEIGLNQALVSQYISGQIGRFQLFISNTNEIRLFIGGTPNIDVTAGVIVPNTVYDVEFERFGNLYTVKLNGLLIISIESSTDILHTTSTSICSFDAGGLPLTLRGNLYYFEIEGVCEYTLQDNTGNITYDNSGNGNHSIITNAILEDFRGTYVDDSQSVLIENGYSKYLVNTTAGTTTTLADPEGQNLGVENIIDGGFDIDNEWLKTGTWSISGGVASCNKTTGYLYQVNNNLEVGKTYAISYEIKELSDGYIRVGLGDTLLSSGINRYTPGFYTDYIIFDNGTAQNYLGLLNSSTAVGVVDNISVKEVTSIPAYGEWEFTSMKGGDLNTSSTFFISDTHQTIIDGYYFAIIGDEGLSMLKRDGGSNSFLLRTSADYININESYNFKIQRNSVNNEFFTSPVNWFRLLIKGGIFTEWTVVDTTGGIGTNPVFDDTHTTTKYLVVDNDTDDEISHISKDSIKYDLDNFTNVTGEYDVVYVTGLNDESSDAKGNEIEIPKNVVSNNNILFDGVQLVDIETDATFDDIHSLENSSVVEIIKDNLTVSNLKIIE